MIEKLFDKFIDEIFTKENVPYLAFSLLISLLLWFFSEWIKCLIDKSEYYFIGLFLTVFVLSRLPKLLFRFFRKRYIINRLSISPNGVCYKYKEKDNELFICKECWDNNELKSNLTLNEQKGIYKCEVCGDEGVYDNVIEKKYNNSEWKKIQPWY